MASRIHPVILCGGAGTRLWPVSRKQAPKQLHPMVTDRTLLQDTALRTRGRVGDVEFAAPVVVTNAAYAEAVREQLDAAGAPAAAVLLEPEARNTAPAVAAVAAYLEAADPDGLALVLPADHHIADAAAFAAALAGGAEAAQAGRIVTFGVTPSRPETGYGYIRTGAPLVGSARVVEAFVEKPERAAAEAYLASGEYLWNAGIFLFAPAVMRAEMERLCPDTYAGAAAAIARGPRDAPYVRLDAAAFADCPKAPVDVAVMEKTDRAAVVEIDVGWSDVGSWAAIWEVARRDAHDNAAPAGAAMFIESAGSLAYSGGPRVIAIGVKDLMIVATDDAVIVAPREDAQRVKEAVERLKADGLEELL